MICAQLERDLDAYIDRELERDADVAFREHLAVCARCRGRVAERETLGRLVRSIPYYPAPPRLRARIEAAAARTPIRRKMLWWAAAAVLVMSTLGAFAVFRPHAVPSDILVDEVVDGHVRSLMADHLFDVQSTDQHTVKPWFLGKLDFAPPVVDLAARGFPLVGGRLDYLDGRPVAALVYRRRQHTINVFVRPESSDSSRGTIVRTVRGFHVRAWRRGGMMFWAVSDVNDAELREFVDALQR
jgi:anti-sigma factor RsiW